MKKLTCEICGSNDLIKKDDFFECETCGSKYSVEEVKKIVLEGNINISGSTVKIDNSSNIENCLNLAKYAYEIGDWSKSKMYCDKILELDSKNYEAWFIKGKSIAWQSYIQEAIICFFNTLDNAPEDKIDEIKVKLTNEAQEIMLSIILWRCKQFLTVPNPNSKQFVQYPSVVDAELVIENAKFIKQNLEKLLLRCEFENSDLGYKILLMIYNFAVDNWNNEIVYEYSKIQQHPSWEEWQCFWMGGDAVVYLIEKSISLLDENNSIFTAIYENLINIYEIVISENDKYISKDKLGHRLSREYDYIRANKIMEWHKKWKELDSTHIIPD